MCKQNYFSQAHIEKTSWGHGCNFLHLVKSWQCYRPSQSGYARVQIFNLATLWSTECADLLSMVGPFAVASLAKRVCHLKNQVPPNVFRSPLWNRVLDRKYNIFLPCTVCVLSGKLPVILSMHSGTHQHYSSVIWSHKLPHPVWHFDNFLSTKYLP